MQPCFLTATEASKLYASGDLTVTDLAISTLERIKARDQDVKGWAYINEDLVLKRAKELDALPKDKRGPLHGVTVAVKDVILTKGAPGAALFRLHQPDHAQICRPSTTHLCTRTRPRSSMQVDPVSFSEIVS